MPLSWNEIKERAVAFSKEWETAVSEDSDAKSFWDGFFNVFGVNRRRVATFEYKVTKADSKDGFIDLLWKGVLLVEHKSAGKNLDLAHKQAVEYFPGLKDHELPKYICVCNFHNFRIMDLDEQTEVRFELKDLAANVQHFGFLAGYQKRTFKDQAPINIEAAYRMGKLHDEMKAIGYEGHDLEVFLERILFCLFAEDTTIFEKEQFKYYIETKTREDGSDLGAQLAQLFQVLNTAKANRFKFLDEDLNSFPYVNGKLFEEVLPIAAFNSKMRDNILNCSALDWSLISPAIFGSLFQSVKNPVERRNLGAHYTSEKNILKVIKPLFLDELWNEFQSIKHNKNLLREFHKKLATLRFLDPACGCGNFLAISYRELRLLELEVLKLLQDGTQLAMNLDDLVFVSLDQFYGIEIDEWPCRIAEVAMWLMEHQMNLKLSEMLGQYFVRLPLGKTANITNANALRIDWNSLCDEQFNFIFGNPPFIGKHFQNLEQKKDMELVFDGVKGAGVLDFVSAWYLKSAKYLAIYEEFKTKIAFVSTNSISQGEQVGILWNELFNRYKIKIHFAHRTFKWGNEARGVAAVHVVIIGFSNFDISEKHIFEYDDIKADPHEVFVKNINPYLVGGRDIIILSREKSICKSPKVAWGNKPVDGGNLILTDLEKNEFLKWEPNATKFIKPLISAKEFLNGVKRWCLWLVDATPGEIRSMPLVLERVKKVKAMREASIDIGARKLASRASQFRDLKNPISYILIPSTTSENRVFIPFAFFTKDNIPHNSCHIVLDGSLFHFGVLTSEMHMSWVKYVCGRLKSDFRYSKDIVYNNYPWPENPTEQQKEAIEKAAQKVLDVRAEFPDSSLASLYDPLTMPPALVKAHQDLDKAVDLAYRKDPFTSESKRIEFLFELYEKYTAGMFKEEKKKRRGK